MIAIVHLWRLLKWGRRLARSGGLRPFEDRRLPFAVRLLAKVARFGTGAPTTPDFAAGLAAVGPAAIKLGQALATRPDLIGLEAATDLARDHGQGLLSRREFLTRATALGQYMRRLVGLAHVRGLSWMVTPRPWCNDPTRAA